MENSLYSSLDFREASLLLPCNFSGTHPPWLGGESPLLPGKVGSPEIQ